MRPYLEQLRTLPFVHDLDFSASGRDTHPEVDGMLKVRTPKGTYDFLVDKTGRISIEEY